MFGVNEVACLDTREAVNALDADSIPTWISMGRRRRESARLFKVAPAIDLVLIRCGSMDRPDAHKEMPSRSDLKGDSHLTTTHEVHLECIVR